MCQFTSGEPNGSRLQVVAHRGVLFLIRNVALILNPIRVRPHFLSFIRLNINKSACASLHLILCGRLRSWMTDFYLFTGVVGVSCDGECAEYLGYLRVPHITIVLDFCNGFLCLWVHQPYTKGLKPSPLHTCDFFSTGTVT